MSNATPTPPPHRLPQSSMVNSYNDLYDPRMSGRERPSSITATYGGNGTGASSQPRSLPHIRDLVAGAERQVDSYTSIGKLLERADAASKQAPSLLDFGRPEYAYVEYLVATHIVANLIPRHKDAPSLQRGNDRLHRLNREIIKRLASEQAKFDRIEEMIKDDNRRTGIRQSSEVRSGASISRPLSSESTPLSPRYQNDGRPLSVPIAPSKSSPPLPLTLLQPRSFAAPFVQDGLAPPSAPARPRPPVHPKPQNLHGIVIASDGRQTIVKSNTSNMNGLTERFSQLRTTNGSLEPSHRGHNSVQSHHPDPRYAESNGYSNVSYIFGSDRSSGFDYQSSSQQSNGDFNTIPSNGQPYLNHISINPSLSKDLPKAPSPTYSPVRSMQTGPPMQPPRSSVRTPVTGRPPSAASHDFVNHQLATNDYFASGEGSVHHPEKTRPPQMRRKSINLPLETKINAEKLYDYLKTFDVLLIDVRSREDYDAGHIFSTNGMCIEPAALRLNMSADELQESLVLSPEAEQVLFDQRDEFDLVVYYDQSTDSTDFLKNHENPRSKAPLRYLYDALYEFNQEKPLRWAPILLVGGMDAWVDLLGGQALATSNTAVSRKATRPLARRPLTKNSSRLTITKKRRDYNPLDPEEEKKWRERARSESINLDSRPLKDVDIEEEVIEAESQLNARGYDKFATRFPEVAAVETQSIPIQLSLPPEPPRVPSYPTPPASNYQAASASNPIHVPNVPSRPPPSVPRPSYSGVSDRVIPQTVVTTRTSQLAPYIPPELRQLPRTGLHNFGVTCYMNATIQCLSATIPLTAFFLDGAFYKYIQRDNWKGSKGLMPELYNTLLRNLWTANQIDTIRPTNFRKFCARLNKEWGIDRQQDAKEFLEFLVDCLHEDLNVKWSRNPLRALTANEESERERTPPFVASKREWVRYEHRDHSRLTDFFAGQHISRLQCTTCHHSSTTYEPFYSISVEIPQPKVRTKPVTLTDCLRSYCSAEMLSGEEVWRCPHCRCEREATKRITITRAPEFLVIHFKRFSASHAEKARKVHTPIAFPLTHFDLQPFMLPPLSADPAAPQLESEDYVRKRYGEREVEDVPEAMRPPYRYDAYAVMRHIGGTMTSGHYIAAVVVDRARGIWREFNDDRVSDFRPEDLREGDRRCLQSETAYIVFYQRVRS